jgi:thioredoxin-like negative regulator of GroEL
MTNTLSQVEGAELREIDINDENSLSLMEKYNIRTIPTVIILNEDDSIKEVFKGIVPKESIENAIR